MWISPVKITSKYDAEILRTNELFDVLRWRYSMLKGVVSKSRFGPYRIVLKDPNASYIVAVGKSLEEVLPQWKVISETIMPDIRKNNSNDSKSEICEFLLVKCDSFSRLQELEETDRLCLEFNSIFKFKQEKLINSYKCSLWKRKPIILYLSENYICYHPDDNIEFGNLNECVISWKKVTVIKKRRVLARDTAISLHYDVDNDHKELFFYGFSNRDEVASIMDQLWQNIMQKLLRSAENNTSLVDQNKSRRKSVLNVSNKLELENHLTHSEYNTTFRLPRDEKLLLEINCKTWEGNGYKIGQICISKYFLCFRSTRGKDIRIAIPFREIRLISKENSMLGVRSRAIKVTNRYRRFLFVFHTQKERDSSYNTIIDKWNRALGLCNLLSFTVIPIERRTAIGMKNLLLNEKEFNSNYVINQQKIINEWDHYSEKHGKKTGMSEDVGRLFSLLKQGGIPDLYRPWAWILFSGAMYKSSCSPKLGYYYSLLQEAEEKSDPDVQDEINKDIHRSFPEHEFFQSDNGIQCLKNVLTAYAIRNPSIGYCQSMNIIAALLLIYLPDEWAFWTLTVICEDIVPENYDQHMIGSIVDQSTFEELLSQTLPRLFSHLKEMDVQIGMITQGWFICLFIGYLPLEISLQILDMFFFLRGRMLYAVGLAVFKCYETTILEMTEADEIVVFLRDLHFCPDLLKTSYKYLEELDNDSIEEMKSAGKFEVIKEMEKTTKNSAIRAVLDLGTKFEMPELYQIYSVFQRIAPPNTFTVNENQFVEILNELVPWTEWRNDLFHPLFICNEKKDNLGFVDVAIILSNCCKGTLRERISFYFKLHDINNEDKLDEGDYYRTLDAVVRSYYNDKLYESDLHALVSWTFKEADSDNDNKVSLSEICTLLLPSAVSGGKISSKEEDDAQLGLLRHFLKQ